MTFRNRLLASFLGLCIGLMFASVVMAQHAGPPRPATPAPTIQPMGGEICYEVRGSTVCILDAVRIARGMMQIFSGLAPTAWMEAGAGMTHRAGVIRGGDLARPRVFLFGPHIARA